MNLKLALSTLIVGTSIFSAGAYAADTPTGDSKPMTYVKDSVITGKVKARLAAEKMSSLVRVNVDTDAKGAVALSGTAKTQQDADKAVEIARATEGVTSVSSKIQVKSDL